MNVGYGGVVTQTITQYQNHLVNKISYPGFRKKRSTQATYLILSWYLYSLNIQPCSVRCAHDELFTTLILDVRYDLEA